MITSPSPGAPRHKRLIFPSSLAELDRVVQEAETFAGAHTSDEDLIYRVVLLTTEAVTNAVEHGNRLDPGKKVYLDFASTDGHIEVCVEDEGGGFDAGSVASPILEENLLREGGRGIFLIETMADEHHFDRGGRRLRMIFRYPTSAR